MKNIDVIYNDNGFYITSSMGEVLYRMAKDGRNKWYKVFIEEPLMFDAFKKLLDSNLYILRHGDSVEESEYTITLNGLCVVSVLFGDLPRG